jgi:hypothetical protein
VSVGGGLVGLGVWVAARVAADVAVGVDVAVGSGDGVLVGPTVAVSVDVERAPLVANAVPVVVVGVGEPSNMAGVEAGAVAVGEAVAVAVAVELAVGGAVAEGKGDGEDDGVLVTEAPTDPDSVADAADTGDAVGCSASVSVGLAAAVLVRCKTAMASVGWGDLLRPTTEPISRNKPAIRRTATRPSPAMAQPGGRRTCEGPNHGSVADFFATPWVFPAL